MIKRSHEQSELVAGSLLLFATMIWGLGFIGTKWTLISYDVYWANGFRYVVAAAFAFPIIYLRKSFVRYSKQELMPPLIAGSILLLAMLFQVIGLETTTVAKSGFITTFYAFFIPLFEAVVEKKKIPAYLWALIGMALVGIFLLCNLSLSDFNKGDFFTFLCAIASAAHIIYVGKIASKVDSSIEFNALQCFYMGLIGFIVALAVKGPMDMAPIYEAVSSIENLSRPSSFWGFIILGLFSSLIAFSIQISAQKRIPASIVGLIFLMESVFAALFGYLLLGETLTMMNIFGCFLVMLSVAILSLKQRRNKKRGHV
jgi:drug/metabolite transporter (DMT)-like permease